MNRSHRQEEPMFGLTIRPAKIAGLLNVETRRQSMLVRRFDGRAVFTVSR